MLSHIFQGYKLFHEIYEVRKMKCTHQGYMLSFTLFIYFCIIVKKKTSMVVIENQLGLSSETSKKNLTTGDENVLIEEIFKYEGTLYGKMKGSEGGRGYC